MHLAAHLFLIDDLKVCVACAISLYSDMMQFQVVYKVTCISHHADTFLRHSLHFGESLSLGPLSSLFGMNPKYFHTFDLVLFFGINCTLLVCCCVSSHSSLLSVSEHSTTSVYDKYSEAMNTRKIIIRTHK